MSENEIGYRGSKSIARLCVADTAPATGYPHKNFVIVKEQRVDGSWHNGVCLRYTLMDFERNYQVKIPSNQINKRSFSSIASAELSQDKLQIDP